MFDEWMLFWVRAWKRRIRGKSGVVKSKIVEYALRPNRNIQCAEDIKRFCDEQLTKHSTTRLKKRIEDITKRFFHVVKQIP